MAMTEAPYSITFKTPRGNLFTVRGNDARDLGSNLNAAPEEGLLALIVQIESTLASTPGSVVASRPSAVAPRAAATAAAPASTGGQELPSGFGAPRCVECDEPTRFDREGVSQKSGKPYKRYLCTGNPTHKATFTD